MDDFFTEIDEMIYRFGGSWTAYLVRALWSHSEGLARPDVLGAVMRDAWQRGRTIPATFPDVIQATFQQHNRGSDVFRADACQDIFRFVGRKGDGVWALNPVRAMAWLIANGRERDLG